jgi:hypothetical protein
VEIGPPFFLALVDSLQLFPAEDSLASCTTWVSVTHHAGPARRWLGAGAGRARAVFADSAVYETALETILSKAIGCRVRPRLCRSRALRHIGAAKPAVYEMTWETGPGKLLGRPGRSRLREARTDWSIRPAAPRTNGRPTISCRPARSRITSRYPRRPRPGCRRCSRPRIVSAR